MKPDPLPFKVGQFVQFIDKPGVIGIVTRCRRRRLHETTEFGRRNLAYLDVKILANGDQIKMRNGDILPSISGAWVNGPRLGEELKKCHPKI